MKKVIVLMMAALLLSGCGYLNDHSNTRTYYDTNGFVTHTDEFSDDAAYYMAAAEAKKAQVINCPTCTPMELALITAINALSDKGFVPRGMNGYELVAELGRDAVAIAPYGAIGFVAYEALKRPGVEMGGDNATYSPFETHQTGSDGSNISVPYRYTSPDNITTEIFEPAVLSE